VFVNAQSLMDTRKKFDDVCHALNMDGETADSAWDRYKKTDEDYGLEVSDANNIFSKLHFRITISFIYSLGTV